MCVCVCVCVCVCMYVVCVCVYVWCLSLFLSSFFPFLFLSLLKIFGIGRIVLLFCLKNPCLILVSTYRVGVKWHK